MKRKNSVKLFPKEIVFQLNDIDKKIAEVMEKKGLVRFV
jgi:hypothetical protein